MMKTKLTLFVTVLAAALFGVGCASVPKGPPVPHAVKWNGHWYNHVTNFVSWTESENECESMGGYLVITI